MKQFKCKQCRTGIAGANPWALCETCYRQKNNHRQDWTPEEIVQKVKLGMTRDEVQAVLGPPHDWNIGTRKYWRPMVWKYNETELHFGHELDSGLCLVGLYEDPENHITLLQ